jgi:hypothetical protein
MQRPIVLDLPDDETALERAQDIANQNGTEVVVKDAAGRELFRVPPARRNEIAIRRES